MTRILVSLVIADLLLLVGASALGLCVERERFFAQHFILALFGMLTTVFTHVVAFTYFAGTGKMISQAVSIGRLDRWPMEKATEYKSRVTRSVGIAAVAIVAAGAFGAITMRNPAWHWWHFTAAAGAIMVNGWAFRVEYRCIRLNARLMDAVFEAYNATRNVPAE